MFRYFAAMLLAAVFFNTQADARTVNWSIAKSPIQLSGYPAGEVEGDYALQLTCLSGANVRIGVGAYKDIGKGRSGVFSVTLKSGDRSVTLSGKSAESSNVEMTGSRELRTQMPLTGELLAVLSNGLPITVSGALSDSWTVNGLAGKVSAFGAGCSKK